MKNYIISSLLIGLIIFAGSGLLMMDHMDMQGQIYCPFSGAGMIGCDQFKSHLDFVVSHAKAVLGLFYATPIFNVAGLFLYSFLVLVLWALFSSNPSLFIHNYLIVRQTERSLVPLASILFSGWFSLHENSPSYLRAQA